MLLAIGGNLDIAIATETSWQPIGKPGRITASSGKTILVTSHDADVYASPVVDRVVDMHDGELITAQD